MMLRDRSFRLTATLLLGALCGRAADVALSPAEPSPLQVGTLVVLEAAIQGEDPAPGAYWYRFRVRQIPDDFRIVRDFSPAASLTWTALEEGGYEIEVTARAADSGATSVAVQAFEFRSAVVDGSPAISPTSHALVFLYSAPPCPAGSRMQVHWQTAGAASQQTPYRRCAPGKSMNFYVAGLLPGAEYTIAHRVQGPSGNAEGPSLTFETLDPGLDVAGYALLKPPPSPEARGVLVQSGLSQAQVATDLQGRVMWYHSSDIQTITRVEPDGVFFGIAQYPFGTEADQIVREFDLQGLTIRETNAARVNEQLEALGRRKITGFHHEARRLPGGRIAVLASAEEILTDVQGEGPVNVIGDVIVVLDEDLQVVWTWDGFEHLDVTKPALLEETCTPAGGGCPPFYLAPQANDWTHANSIQYTPDGNLLLSIRHLDWVVKIDYSDGEGSGQVLWRLGKDGDFTAVSNDPEPWFSHQHDAQILADGSLLLFDNGNLRRANDDTANSRGQLWRLDEKNRTATLALNADLGSYSPALGSAQPLPGGNYHFVSGFIRGARSQFLEVAPSGAVTYNLEAGTQIYRCFRMEDMYSPPQ